MHILKPAMMLLRTTTIDISLRIVNIRLISEGKVMYVWTLSVCQNETDLRNLTKMESRTAVDVCPLKNAEIVVLESGGVQSSRGRGTSVPTSRTTECQHENSATCKVTDASAYHVGL